MHNYDLVVQDAKETTLKCQCSILELFPVFRGKITLVNFWFILVTTLYRQLGNDPKETTGTLGRAIQFLSRHGDLTTMLKMYLRDDVKEATASLLE